MSHLLPIVPLDFYQVFVLAQALTCIHCRLRNKAPSLLLCSRGRLKYPRIRQPHMLFSAPACCLAIPCPTHDTNDSHMRIYKQGIVLLPQTTLTQAKLPIVKLLPEPRLLTCSALSPTLPCKSTRNSPCSARTHNNRYHFE